MNKPTQPDKKRVEEPEIKTEIYLEIMKLLAREERIKGQKQKAREVRELVNKYYVELERNTNGK